MKPLLSTPTADKSLKGTFLSLRSFTPQNTETASSRWGNSCTAKSFVKDQASTYCKVVPKSPVLCLNVDHQLSRKAE